jgi:hypothetical protein
MKYKFVFITLLFVPQLLLAQFKSKEELIDSFKSVGVQNIIKVDNPNLNETYVSTLSTNSEISINAYSREFGNTRQKNLDIKTGKFIIQKYEAYIFADSVLCYTSFKKIQRNTGQPNYEFCLFASQPFSTIIEKLNTNKNKYEYSEKEYNTSLQ